MGLGGSKPSSESAAETREQATSNGQQVNAANASGPAGAQENGHGAPQPKQAGVQKRRMSFYETVDASEVLSYLIIGNLASSKNKEFLSRKNVKFILNLTNEESEEIEGIETKQIQMEDDDDQDLLTHLPSSFDFINKANQSTPKKDAEKPTVLVHSYFGMSRSSAVIVAYLMKEKSWCLKEAYQHIKDKHPSVNPNDNFVVQLIRYEQELYGKMSMTVKDFH